MEEVIKLVSTIFGMISVIIVLVIRFEARYNKISTRLTALEQKIEPFWEIIKNNLAKLFTENPSKALLDKLDKVETLTIEELQEAKKEFETEMKVVDPSKKINYL